MSSKSIVYVAGYGRSGSTLLDTLLGNHPQAIGVGELFDLFEYARKDRECSCGAKIRQCEFWSSVAHKSGLDLSDEAKLVKLNELTVQTESRSVPASEEYAARWTSLSNSILEISQKDFIVDSSKTARLHKFRPLHLNRACGFNVKVLHLVRDPRAVMWSINRGSNQRLEAGLNPKVPGGMVRGLYGWSRANLFAESLKKDLGGENYELVRYEDLVQQPREQLTKIGKFLGVEMDSVIEMINSDSAFSPGHGVSGNRMRRNSKLTFKFDDEWMKALPPSARLISKVVAKQSTVYGYEL